MLQLLKLKIQISYLSAGNALSAGVNFLFEVVKSLTLVIWSSLYSRGRVAPNVGLFVVAGIAALKKWIPTCREKWLVKRSLKTKLDHLTPPLLLFVVRVFCIVHLLAQNKNSIVPRRIKITHVPKKISPAFFNFLESFFNNPITNSTNVVMIPTSPSRNFKIVPIAMMSAFSIFSLSAL